MWLAANQKPDFRTINAFRGERLKSVIEEVFTATVKLLYEKGYVKLEKYFVDGTKIESTANKYRYNFDSRNSVCLVNRRDDMFLITGKCGTLI